MRKISSQSGSFYWILEVFIGFYRDVVAPFHCLSIHQDFMLNDRQYAMFIINPNLQIKTTTHTRIFIFIFIFRLPFIQFNSSTYVYPVCEIRNKEMNIKVYNKNQPLDFQDILQRSIHGLKWNNMTVDDHTQIYDLHLYIYNSLPILYVINCNIYKSSSDTKNISTKTQNLRN